MATYTKDNLTELLRYRALLLSRSSVVSHELEVVTNKIAKVLSHPEDKPNNSAAPLLSPGHRDRALHKLTSDSVGRAPNHISGN